MPSLKEVKNRINSVKSTQQITKAMKMVAAAKLRRAQERIIQLRPYSQKLSGILDNVSSTLSGATVSPYAEERNAESVLIVAITSDRGLCGSFNTNVNRKVQGLLDNEYKQHMDAGKVKVLCIGTKSRDYLKRYGYPILEDYVELFGHLDFENARKAAEFAMDGFLGGKFDKVEIVYNEFKNVATQICRHVEFLPLKEEPGEGTPNQNLDYIFEPRREEIVQELIPYSLKIAFYRYLLESNAAEHGARMTAMDQATDNAKELLRELNLTYNRTRQAAITKEILEIVGGAEALGKS